MAHPKKDVSRKSGKKAKTSQKASSSKRKKGPAKAPELRHALKMDPDQCAACGVNLKGAERALFVEEEIGRVFCSEECISHYFAPEIERLEKEYLDRVSEHDLPVDVKESLAHLRWLTLREPHEVWCEKTLSGDHRYVLISQYHYQKKSIWSICVSLFLRGEPSFLFIAFVTKDASIVDHFRKGEPVQWSEPRAKKILNVDQMSVEEIEEPGTKILDQEAGVVFEETPEGMKAKLIDGLADSWTKADARMAKAVETRSKDDIPVEDFGEYDSYFEQTLDLPDEIWSIKDEKSPRIYHFIRKYKENEKALWYVVIAKETEEVDQFEILEAFPSRDEAYIENFRQGTQEMGVPAQASTGRVIH